MLCLIQMPVPAEVLSDVTLFDGDDLWTRFSVSTRLFHELSHAAINTSKTTLKTIHPVISMLIAIIVIGDQKAGIGQSGEQYGWTGAQNLRSTIGPQNPDSLMQFAQVLTMKSYIWDLGYAVSYSTRWTILDTPGNVVGATTIQKYGLFNPVFMRL
jgi:hypothetical protein